MIEIGDEYGKWYLRHQEYLYKGTVGFIVVRENRDGSRDVLKDGRSYHVSPGVTVDSVCGPTVEVPFFEIQPRGVI